MAARSAHDEVTKSLETAKFRLLQQMSKDEKLKVELEQKIAAAESKVFERRQKLGEYNALFMTLPDASKKAPAQRLGATMAVLGTRRIIDRELTKISNEIATQGMKLNKAKDRNVHAKAQIDSLRKEQLTYKKLFATMNRDLEALKEKIADLRKSIDDGYHARDRAQEEMRELAKQFELDKLERQREWALYTAAIDEANKEGQPTLTGGAGLLTHEENDKLKKKIRKGQLKMAKDRGVLMEAQAKHAAFQLALSYIRTSTGYDNLQDVIDLFNKYEEDKFEKLGAVNRMLIEIERLELSNVVSREDVKGKESSDVSVKAARTQAVSSLEAQAAHLEAQADETHSSAQRIVDETKALFPFVEVLFSSLGCDAALAPRTEDAFTPLSKPTASLSMYASPALAEEVKGGHVTASMLPQYIGMLENRGADVIQMYAAMVTMGTLAEDGGAGYDDAEAAARKAEADEIKMLQAAETAAAGALGDGTAHVPEAAAPTDTMRRFVSAAALGPSRPTGKLKENLTTSALVAAMAVAASSGPAPGPVADGAAAGAATRRGAGARHEPAASSRRVDDEPEDDAGAPARPFSKDELKKIAAAQLGADKSVKAIGAAASAAATILGRGIGGAV